MCYEFLFVLKSFLQSWSLYLFSSTQPSSSLAPLQCYTGWNSCVGCKQWPLLFCSAPHWNVASDDHQHSHLQVEAGETTGTSLLDHVCHIRHIKHSIRTCHTLHNRWLTLHTTQFFLIANIIILCTYRPCLTIVKYIYRSSPFVNIIILLLYPHDYVHTLFLDNLCASFSLLYLHLVSKSNNSSLLWASGGRAWYFSTSSFTSASNASSL